MKKHLAVGLSAVTLAACMVAEPDVPIGRGWSAADLTGGTERACDFAVQTVYERFPTRALVDTISAETQLVAGMNHRCRIEMGGSPTARAIYSVVVYEDLDGALEVTAFDKIQ